MTCVMLDILLEKTSKRKSTRTFQGEIFLGREQLAKSGCIVKAAGSHFYHENLPGVLWDKSDSSPFPQTFIFLSWHCSERPPASPPNPGVIAAGGNPVGFAPIFQTPKRGVRTDNIQMADSEFPCGAGARDEGSKIRTLFTLRIILQKKTGLDLKSGGHE